jgi:ketosteroid isomerase-like protein
MQTIRTLSPVIFMIIMVFSGCSNTGRRDKEIRELLNVDREFSDLSAKLGSHTAFLSYIDDSCVLLRPNRMPVIGRKKIVEMFNKPDTSFTLTWVPLSGEVSESGDMGFTYGIYTVHMDDPEGKAVTKEGTYATVWKKDKSGKWKFILDTGNQGTGQKNEGSE